MPTTANIVDLFTKRKWIVFATLSWHYSVIVLVFVEDLFVGSEVHLLDETIALVVLRQIVGHWVEGIIIHY